MLTFEFATRSFANILPLTFLQALSRFSTFRQTFQRLPAVLADGWKLVTERSVRHFGGSVDFIALTAASRQHGGAHNSKWNEQFYSELDQSYRRPSWRKTAVFKADIITCLHAHQELSSFCCKWETETAAHFLSSSLFSLFFSLIWSEDFEYYCTTFQLIVKILLPNTPEFHYFYSLDLWPKRKCFFDVSWRKAC